MFNFFASENSRQGDFYYITGSDYNHIINVLRMKKGDTFLVSSEGKGDLCELYDYDTQTVTARIVEENYKNTDLPVEIYLFQGLPKADKMELIIQKTVELGVHAIVPVEMNRCVVKLDDKKKKSKRERWQSISESAAKQSKRNIIPEVYNAVSYKDMLKMASEMDLFLVPYENKDGMKSTMDALSKIKSAKKIGILIGPEGGFEEKEVEEAVNAGGKTVSLGSRILRTETAAITAVGMCMLHIEMNSEASE